MSTLHTCTVVFPIFSDEVRQKVVEKENEEGGVTAVEWGGGG